MKYKTLILLLLFTQLLSAQSKGEGVKLISATTQNWFTGAAPGRSGTTYTIKVKIMATKPVVFKNLWIGKENVEFKIATFFTAPDKKPAMGDSLLIIRTKQSKPQNEPKESNLHLPYQYKGEALLEYYVAGRPRYLEIEKFEKQAAVKGQ